MSIVSFSLPPKQITAVNQLAEKQNRSRSQVVQEAIDLYEFESKWQVLRKAGDLIAKRLGIESDDDVQQIFG